MDVPVSLVALRVVLVATAIVEATRGGIVQVFFARRSAELEHRRWEPDYHAVIQDFGFYNLAVAALFAVAAFDPARYRAVIAIGAGMYVVHGATHLLRYFGLYYGEGAAVADRPARLDLQQGLTLLAAAAGLVLFFPGNG